MPNFDTSQVTDMNQTFYNCSLLKTLNLSDFYISDFNKFNNIFYWSQIIEYINLIISNVNREIKDIFLSTYQNLMICRNNIDDILLKSFTKINIHCKNKIIFFVRFYLFFHQKK